MTKTETVLNDIYDAWRAQDLEWLASYLPEEFAHTVDIPPEVHPRQSRGADRRPRKRTTRSTARSARS
jgi:hypothetical protein